MIFIKYYCNYHIIVSYNLSPFTKFPNTNNVESVRVLVLQMLLEAMWICFIQAPSDSS